MKVPGTWNDESSYRRAEVLHIAQVFTFFGGFLYLLLPSWVLNGQPFYIGITFLISVTGHVLLRTGKLRWSAVWTIGMMWILFTVGSSTEGGITSSSFAGSIAMVVFAGLAYGVNASIFLTFLSIGVGGVLVYLGHHHLLPAQQLVYSDLNIYSDYVFYIFITGLFTVIAVRRVDKSTRQFEHELQERRAIQDRLLERDKRFRALAGSALDAYWMVDRNGTLLDVNDVMCRMLGYSRDELLQMSIVDIDASQTPGEVEQQLREIVTKGSGRFETFHRRKNGEVFEVEVSATSMPDANQLIGFARDISGRKKAEEATRLLAHTMESMAEIATITDLDDRLTYVNQAFLDAYGYRREEILGKHIGVLWSPNNPASLLDDILQQNRAKDWKGEVMNLRKNGDEFPISLHTSRIRDKNGKIVGLVGIAEDITERKHAEQALRESEKQFRSLYENSTIGIYRTTPDGRILISNPAAIRMLGYDSFEDLASRNLEEEGFEPTYPRSEFRQRLERDGVIAGLETAWVRKDGSMIYVRESTTVVRDDVGRVLYYDGTFEDITDQKRAELALKESEDRLKKAQEMAHVGNWEIDLKTKEMWGSNEAFDIYGLQRTDPVLPLHVVQGFVVPEDRPGMDEALRHLIERNKPYDQEFRIKRQSDGSLRYLISKAERVIDASGLPVKVVGMVQDVTERTLAAEELRQSEQRLRLISENVADLIGVTDLHGRVVYASPSFGSIVGDSESYVGKRALDIVYPEDRKRVTEFIRSVVTTGVSNRVECRLVTLDGSTRDVETIASVVRDHAGRVTSVVVVSRDVTEKKQLEQQFLRAQRLESLGTLAGGVAHDLNNVLNPIMLAVDSLRKYVTHERGIKILAMLESSAVRGGNIVKQVLGFARGIKGERDAIQVRHLARDIVSIIQETFPKGITIKTNLSKDTKTIIGDPTQVHQVIMNLCVNARDAMPNGGTISIRLQNAVIDLQYSHMHIDARPGQYVLLTVEDNGVGMPPNILDRIFEPFFTTKDSGQGTGLGLSTVHTIVKSHGGFVNVYSEVGKGTSFKVYLPAADAERVKEQDLKPESPMRGNGELILVVDDEPTTCEITKQTLESNGYRVITASDGAEGVARFVSQADQIALVFTDMMMPIMDGPRMTHALRRLNPSVKVIASSGLHSNGEITGGEHLNIQAFLAKPYNSEKLLATIKKVLSE